MPLILAVLTSCSDLSGQGAPAPIPLPASSLPARLVPIVLSTQPSTLLLIPANIPPDAATAIFEYFRLLNQALATGRTAELEESVAFDCPCLTPVAGIKEIYRDGILLGAKNRILRMSLVAISSEGATIQVQSMRSQATRVTNSTGAREVLAEHSNTTDFILENFSGVWLVMSSKLPA